MLSLTHSFCRYLKLTYENVSTSRIHVNRVVQVVKETCSNNPYTPPIQQIRPYAKKKFNVKELFSNSNENKSKMSESMNPTMNHVSFGGQFEISNDEDGPSEDWHNRFGGDVSKELKQPPPVPPNFRIWEYMGKKCDSHDGKFKFRVVSYNVLAQYLLECHPYLYTDCALRDLKWKVRAQLLFDEIVSLQPDIICLQEVQASHLKSFYSKFEELGYHGIFKQKTGHRHDGCAIYFKHSLFLLQDHISVEFYQPEVPILNRDNIGMMVKLAPKCLSDSPIVVATTHLLFNPKRTDVRVAQMQVFLAEIDRFAFFNNGRECGHIPIILTGDFNSPPESAVIKLLDKGIISTKAFRDGSDWQRIGVTDNCQHLAVYLNRQQGLDTDFSMVKLHHSDFEQRQDDQAQSEAFSEMFNSGHVCHSLHLASTYDKKKPDGQCEATTFQDYWLTVDYIYFSSCSSLTLLERLRLPTVEECEVLYRLPNHVYGSDHLALAATFELKPPKSSL